jgi:hypothetical protein
MSTSAKNTFRTQSKTYAARDVGNDRAALCRLAKDLLLTAALRMRPNAIRALRHTGWCGLPAWR